MIGRGVLRAEQGLDDEKSTEASDNETNDFEKHQIDPKAGLMTSNFCCKDSATNARLVMTCGAEK